MRTKLEQFSQQVAADCYDVSIDELSEQKLGVDWANVTKLIEVIGQIIIEIMNNCPEKKALKSSVKNPSWGQRVRFRAAVKSHIDCCGNPQLRKFTGKIADVALSHSSKMEAGEVDQVVDEALDTDNWLI